MPVDQGQAAEDRQTVALESDDGRIYRCRLLGTFELEGREYALLVNLDAAEAADAASPSPIVMRLIKEGDQAIFRTIEDDEELERVMAFIKDIAREMDETDEDG